MTPLKAVFIGIFFLATFLASPAAAQQLPPPFGPETGDALPQTIRELRRCVGPLDAQTAKQFVGTRFLCNAFEVFHASARRALESVAGLDVTGGQRGQNSLLETWRQAGVSEDELQFLQRIAASSLYGWTGAPESERAAAGAIAGGPATAAADQNRISSWRDFQKNVIPITENPHGREALFRLNLLARAANVQEAIENLAPPGEPFPEFKGERADAAGAVVGGPALATANILATNDVAIPASKTADTLAFLTNFLPMLVTSAQDALVPVPRSNPSDPLANPLRGATAQETVKATAFGGLTAGSAGRAAELSGLGFPPSSIPSDIVNQDVLNTLAQRAANAITNQFNSIANATNFLGPAAGELGNLLGPDNFKNLASNLFGGPGGTPQFPDFPPGGGPPRLADIPTRPATPQASCDPQRSTISSDGAKALAIFLGLPPTMDQANPWELQYVEAQRAYRQRGTDPTTGGVRTITQDDFPNPTACVWVVSHAPPGESRAAAFIEDRQSGQKLLLSI